MCGKSAYCWKTMLTERRLAETDVTSRACKTILPSSGTSKPAIILSVVVFPQPLGPSSEKNSPSPIDSVTSFTAATVPKPLLTPSRAIATVSFDRISSESNLGSSSTRAGALSVTIDLDQSLVADSEVVRDLVEDNTAYLSAKPLGVVCVEP